MFRFAIPWGAGAFALALIATPADAFIARNGMRAAQSGPSQITVAWSSGRSDTDYWCAAGDFAQRVLDLPVGTRLWRATPKPRGAGEGIVFTLDPADQAEGAGLSQFGKGPRDGAMSLGQAVTLHCQRIYPLND